MSTTPQDNHAAPDTAQLAERTQLVAHAVTQLDPSQRIVVERILDWILTTAETLEALAKAVAALDQLDDIREAEIASLTTVVHAMGDALIPGWRTQHSAKV